MPSCLVGFVLAFVIAQSVGAQGRERALVIRDVTVIAATGAAPRPHATVIIENGRIRTVTSDREPQVPAGAWIVDGGGKFLVPGLWEMHAHLSKTRGSSLGLYLANGVTMVRDTGGDHQELLRWRKDVTDGRRDGPRMLLAGPYLESARNVSRMRATPPDSMVEPVERTRVPIGSPGDARRVVDSVARLGVDHIKIRTVQDSTTYRAIGEATRKAGKPLTGHVTGFSPEQIFAAGQTSLEHLIYPTLETRGVPGRADVFRRFAAMGMGAVPTLSTFASLFVPDSVVRAVMADSMGRVEPRRGYLSRFLLEDWAEQVLERDTAQWASFRALYAIHVRNTRELHAAGVPVMPGSDVGVLLMYPGSTVHDEMRRFVSELGIQPGEVLERATRIPAEFTGHADSLGTVEPGKVADLVLLDADPLSDIGNVGRIAAVVRAGRLYDRAALDALLERVRSDPDRRRNDWPRPPR